MVPFCFAKGEGFRFFRKRFHFSLPSSLENEMGEDFGRFFALRKNPFKREFENDMRFARSFVLSLAFVRVFACYFCFAKGEGFRFFRKRFHFSFFSSLGNEMGRVLGVFSLCGKIPLRENLKMICELRSRFRFHSL